MDTIKKVKKISLLPVSVMAVMTMILIQSGCKKDDCTVPSIDYLTYRDSTYSINYLVPTQVFTIHGTNFKDFNHLYINHTELNPLYILATDTSITFRMPSMTTNSDTEELNDSILLVKDCGNDLLMVNILLAPPYITKISNEYAIAGNTITLWGYFFSLLESVVFPGDIEGEIIPSEFDTVCEVIVPEGVTEEGKIILTSESGEGNSAMGIRFNDRTGLLCNFDDVDTWEGWGGRVISHSNDPSIPETNGKFYAGKQNNIQPGMSDMNYVTLPISMFTMPDYNGSLTPDYFNLKFEIYTLYPWESGYYTIEIGEINEQDTIEYSYKYKFQPWNDTIYDGSFTTPKWETYNIPLSEFRLSNNDQIPVQSYSQIRAANYVLWSFVNPTEEEGGKFIDFFCVALDNLRIVQVKTEQ